MHEYSNYLKIKLLTLQNYSFLLWDINIVAQAYSSLLIVLISLSRYDGLCEINGYTHQYLEWGYWREDTTSEIWKRLEEYIRGLSHSTNCQLVLSWKPKKLIMVSERTQYTDSLIRPGQWPDHPISWWPIEGLVLPRLLEKEHYLGVGMLDSARLMVIRTIISREGVGEKISHWKYVRDLK